VDQARPRGRLEVFVFVVDLLGEIL